MNRNGNNRVGLSFEGAKSPVQKLIRLHDGGSSSQPVTTVVRTMEPIEAGRD